MASYLVFRTPDAGRAVRGNPMTLVKPQTCFGMCHTMRSLGLSLGCRLVIT